MKYKTLTKAGAERKQYRIMARLLAVQDPAMFRALMHEARRQIQADNRNPIIPIQSNGLNGTPHYTSNLIVDAVNKRKEDLANLRKASK